MIERMAKQNDLHILHVGSWGSKKNLLNSVLNNWLTYNKLKRFAFNRSRFRFSMPYCFFDDGRKESNDIITDAWFLLKKNDFTC